MICVFCSGVGSGGCVVRFDVHGEYSILDEKANMAGYCTSVWPHFNCLDTLQHLVCQQHY